MQSAIGMNKLHMMGAVSIATGLALSLLACAARPTDTATAYPANPSRTDSRGASASMQATGVDSVSVEKLSSARCDHEEACKHVGEGQSYSSRDACMYQMRGSMAKELNSYNCPNGIDQGAVDRCMAAIRNEECGHLLDTLARIDKCRTGALCQQ
jgi:hypothetical protein